MPVAHNVQEVRFGRFGDAPVVVMPEIDFTTGTIGGLPVDVLTDEEVDRLANGLADAGRAAAAKIRSTGGSYLSRWLGNAATQEQAAGAVDNMVRQIEHWRAVGHEKVAAWTANPKTWTAHEEVAWRSAPAEWTKAFGEVTGYAADAALSKSVWSTVDATGQQIAAGAKAVVTTVVKLVPWYVWAGAGVAALAVVTLAFKSTVRPLGGYRRRPRSSSSRR